MKFKFNWGHGILVFLIIFLIFIALIIRYAMNQKINLVTPNYYSKELKYQEEIDKLENTRKLDEKVKVKVHQNHISISFPKLDSLKEITGTIQVYRPSDYDLDLNYIIELKSNREVVLSKDSLKYGLYDLIIDWQYDSVLYLQKERIHIN